MDGINIKMYNFIASCWRVDFFLRLTIYGPSGFVRSGPVREQPVRSGRPTSGAFGVSEKFRGRAGGPRRPQETTGGLQLLPSGRGRTSRSPPHIFLSLFVRLACVRIPERLSGKKSQRGIFLGFLLRCYLFWLCRFF